MLSIKKKYIIDENHNKIAVQLDLSTYEMIEEFLEDHAFAKIMRDNTKKDELGLKEAKNYYSRLKKTK